jgi:hypothetical protein
MSSGQNCDRSWFEFLLQPSGIAVVSGQFVRAHVAVKRHSRSAPASS